MGLNLPLTRLLQLFFFLLLKPTNFSFLAATSAHLADSSSFFLASLDLAPLASFQYYSSFYGSSLSHVGSNLLPQFSLSGLPLQYCASLLIASLIEGFFIAIWIAQKVLSRHGIAFIMYPITSILGSQDS